MFGAKPSGTSSRCGLWSPQGRTLGLLALGEHNCAELDCCVAWLLARRGRLNWLCFPIYVFREGSVLFVRSYNTDYEFELP